jgi:hypothetical protein
MCACVWAIYQTFLFIFCAFCAVLTLGAAGFFSTNFSGGGLANIISMDRCALLVGICLDARAIVMQGMLKFKDSLEQTSKQSSERDRLLSKYSISTVSDVGQTAAWLPWFPTTRAHNTHTALHTNALSHRLQSSRYPLHDAVRAGAKDLIDLLLREGVDVNGFDDVRADYRCRAGWPVLWISRAIQKISLLFIASFSLR